LIFTLGVRSFPRFVDEALARHLHGEGHDIIQVDPALGYGLVEYLRIQDMLKQHGWSSRRSIPHGSHQYSLHIAAALKLGGNESYPGEFQPTAAFADDATVRNSRVGLTDTPGIGSRPARLPPQPRQGQRRHGGGDCRGHHPPDLLPRLTQGHVRDDGHQAGLPGRLT
jgi:hypothetical protein